MPDLFLWMLGKHGSFMEIVRIISYKEQQEQTNRERGRESERAREQHFCLKSECVSLRAGYDWPLQAEGWTAAE